MRVTVAQGPTPSAREAPSTTPDPGVGAAARATREEEEVAEAATVGEPEEEEARRSSTGGRNLHCVHLGLCRVTRRVTPAWFATTPDTRLPSATHRRTSRTALEWMARDRASRVAADGQQRPGRATSRNIRRTRRPPAAAAAAAATGGGVVAVSSHCPGYQPSSWSIFV